MTDARKALRNKMLEINQEVSVAKTKLYTTATREEAVTLKVELRKLNRELKKAEKAFFAK